MYVLKYNMQNVVYSQIKLGYGNKKAQDHISINVIYILIKLKLKHSQLYFEQVDKIDKHLLPQIFSTRLARPTFLCR